MKHLLSYIILISAFVLWALPNETKAQTCDVTVNVQVDFWYWEAQYAVVDASFNFVLPWQSFSSSFQSQSTVLPGLTDGGVYYVVLTDTYGDGGVSGSVTAGGALLTSWSSFSYGSAAYKVFTVDCGAAPLANDLCSGAEPISCGQTVSGSTSAATNDFASFCGTSNTAPGVWYEFTGNGDCVELSTCGYANYDTKITVYSGSCGALSCVAGNDDDFSCTGFRSTVDFSTTAGVQYYVLVHGFSSATGDFDLTMSCSSGPFYDDVCAAPNLGLGIVWGWDNTCAGAQPGEVSPGPGTDGTSSCNSQDGWCSFETGVQTSVWFTFTAPASGCVSIQSAFQSFPYDTQLAVWEVGDCSDFSTFTELAANDDGGFVFSSFVEQLSCLTPGAEYYIQVDGYNGTQGPGAILITDCGNAPLTASSSGCGLVYEGLGIGYACATIDGSASGGFPPYTYSWSNGSTDPSITVCPTATTTYTFTVTDSKGCVTTTDWTVEVMNIFCSGTAGSAAGCGIASGSGSGAGASSSGGPFKACTFSDSGSGSPRSACDNSGSSSGASSPTHVQMCSGGVTHCVLISDINKLLLCGYELGPCGSQQGAACDNSVSSVAVASDCECNGHVASITVRYVGADGQDFNVNTKKCKGLIAAFTGANTGDEFTINASDGGLSYFKNFTYFELVGSGYGSVKIPTNCHCNAQGQRFFPFEVVSWTDTDGNSCPDTPPCEDLNVTITLDNYPSETSFQLENTTTGTILLDVPGGTYAGLAGQTVVESAGCQSVMDCYELRIADSFGDGICCSWGIGNYSVSLGSTVVSSPTGGAFGASETVEIGACGLLKSSGNGINEDDAIGANGESARLVTYPNPLSDMSTFEFIIPETENVKVEVINLNGERVGAMYTGMVEGGTSKRIDFDASELSSGIYFVQLTTPTQFLKEKIVVIK